MIKNILVVAVSLAAFTLSAQRMSKFGSDLGKETAMGKEMRPPYLDIKSYFGYIKPGAKPDEKKNGKKMYYMYVWIPVAAPEIGIRMISPIPEGLKPADTDYIGSDYASNVSDTKSYFDTWISLERADGIVRLEDVASKAKSAKWITLASNDDSNELPEQPSGSKYNSLVRVTSNTSGPEKSLVMGLYRIAFTTFKKGEVQGSFLAQIGAPVALPGVAIAAKPEDLSGSVKK